MANEIIPAVYGEGFSRGADGALRRHVVSTDANGNPVAAGGGGGGAATVADGADVTQGAKADAVATTDTGTFTLIALFKRLLQGVTSLLGLLAGAGTLTTGQVALSTTAGTAAIARSTRRRVTFLNMDAVITIYLGPATVTAANGFRLLAGESVTLQTVGLIQAIAASGTPSLGVADEY